MEKTGELSLDFVSWGFVFALAIFSPLR